MSHNLSQSFPSIFSATHSSLPPPSPSGVCAVYTPWSNQVENCSLDDHFPLLSTSVIISGTDFPQKRSQRRELQRKVCMQRHIINHHATLLHIRNHDHFIDSMTRTFTSPHNYRNYIGKLASGTASPASHDITSQTTTRFTTKCSSCTDRPENAEGPTAPTRHRITNHPQENI